MEEKKKEEELEEREYKEFREELEKKYEGKRIKLKIGFNLVMMNEGE